MKKMLPLFVILVAAITGIAGGFAVRLSNRDLKQGDEVMNVASGKTSEAPNTSIGREIGDSITSVDERKKTTKAHDRQSAGPVYMKFSRQFVTPIVKAGRPTAMMILDVNIELDPSISDVAYSEEPKLRDAVLRVLLRQAGEGRLSEIFQDSTVLEETRAQLLIELRKLIGDEVRSVLIMDVGYQSF